MATQNRDAAASIGLPSAVHEHPGWKQHTFPGKISAPDQLKKNAARSSQAGARLSRRTRAA